MSFAADERQLLMSFPPEPRRLRLGVGLLSHQARLEAALRDVLATEPRANMRLG